MTDDRRVILYLPKVVTAPKTPNHHSTMSIRATTRARLGVGQLRWFGLLWLALLPLLMMAGALVWRVPLGNRWLNLNSREPLVSWSVDDSEAHWCLNIITGDLFRRSKYKLDSTGFSTSDGRRIVLENAPPSTSGVVAAIVEDESGKVLKRIQFEIVSGPTIVGNRYAVSPGKKAISAIDLEADQPEPFILTVPQGTPETWIVPVSGKDQFWRFTDRSLVPTLEVFEISSGRITPLASWAVSPLGQTAYQQDETLLSISPDNRHIEQRLIASGQLLKTFEFPKGFDPLTAEYGIVAEDLLATCTSPGVYVYYDLLSGKKLPLPRSDMILCATTPDKRLRFFMEQRGRTSGRLAVVYDAASHTVVRDFSLPRCKNLSGHFFPGDRLAMVSDRYGLTAYWIDLNTGEVMQRRSPFRWVAIALPTVVLAFAVWAIAWLRVSAAVNPWAWCDIALLGALVMIPLILRIRAVGYLSETDRPPYQYAQGIMFGMFQLSAAWLVFGTARLPLRIIPLVMVVVALAVSLGATLGQREHSLGLACGGLFTTIGPAIGMCAVCGLLRWAGWRLRPTGDEDVLPRDAWRVISIREGLIGITCVAVVLAAVRPMLPGVYLPRWQTPVVVAASLLVVCTTAGLLLATTRRRWLFALGAALACIALVVCVALRTDEFVAGFAGGTIPRFELVAFHIIASGFVATFLFALAYRFRGWRIIRV